MKTVKIEAWAKVNGHISKRFKENDIVKVIGIKSDPNYENGLAFRIENRYLAKTYVCSDWLDFDFEIEKEIPKNAIRKLCRKIQSLLFTWFKKDL